MGITLTFEIILQSDYHIGAGYGKGFHVDSAILREADGTPVIRGSALAGLLRDGTYRLLKMGALANKYGDAERDKILTRLFGSPSQPKHWYITSARPNKPLPTNSDSQTVQRVRIDPRTRRAEPRKLFSLEEGSAKQIFEFTISCPVDDEASWDEAALLVAAARNVRQLGRSRRRGLGECLFRLKEVKGIPAAEIADWQDWFLQRFKERWLEGEPAKPEEEEGQKSKWTLGEQIVPDYAGEPKRFRLILRLDEPLIIARRAPAGQQFEARESIPGTAVLGTLANKAAQRNNLHDPKVYAQFVALFVRGDVMFPTLYPADESEDDIYPSIPAPLGLLTCDVLPFQGQSKGHGLHLGIEGHQKCSHDGCPGKLRPVRDFLSLSDDPPYTYSLSRSSELHIAVDEDTGRAKKGHLYGYTMLDAGQYFVGELTCANEETWKQLKRLTGIVEGQPLPWRLGKARGRGYGKVTAWLEPINDEKSDWIQLPLSERVKDPSQPISLTLLTDTIVQNAWGQQAISFDEDWLEAMLGLGPIKILDAYVRSRVVDGFNSHLGLPRWRDVALVAGSVVWFTLREPPDDWAERMEKLERYGIGLRRNEGFGRIAFNHPIYDQRNKLTDSNIRLKEPMRLKGQPEVEKFAKRWEEKLDDLLPVKLDVPFVAIARWLHIHSHQPLQEVLTEIKSLGEPDESLIETIGGQSEYGARSKDNFFHTQGEEAFENILKALRELAREDEEYHQRGIEILADRIASLASDKEGGSR